MTNASQLEEPSKGDSTREAQGYNSPDSRVRFYKCFCELDLFCVTEKNREGDVGYSYCMLILFFSRKRSRGFKVEVGILLCDGLNGQWRSHRQHRLKLATLETRRQRVDTTPTCG